MRQIAQLISDLFAKNALREVTTTILPPAKTLQSVLTAVKTTFHDPISVKFRKKKKKLVKLKKQTTYLIWKQKRSLKIKHPN